MKKFLTVFTFLLFSIVAHAQGVWSVAGSFSESGWCATCNGMYDDGTHGDAVAADGIFTLDITISTPGRYEWKVAHWSDWNPAFPWSNSWFITTTADQVVKFTYNTNTINDNWLPNTNIINANDNPGPIVAVGDWQGWNNGGQQVMHDDGLDGDDVAGDGIFTYHAVIANANTYQYKACKQGSWDAWGTGSRSVDAGTQTFTTTIPNQNVYMYLNRNTGRISSSAQSQALHLDFTGFIQGLFNETTSKMTPDTVTVELRTAASPYSLVESQKGLLDSNGYKTFYYSTAVNSVPYWFVVKHRNAIETWSYAPVVLSSSPVFDFTWSHNSAYDSNLVQMGTKWCFWSGDVNQDSVVNLSDMIIVDNDNTHTATGYRNSDVNGDGVINLLDMIIVDNSNSRTVSRKGPL